MDPALPSVEEHQNRMGARNRDSTAVADGAHLLSTNYSLEATLRGRGPEEMVNCILALRDGRVVLGYSDHVLKVFHRTEGCVSTLSGHSDEVLGVTEMQDGTIVSASADRTLKTWSEGRCVSTLTGTSAVSCVCVLDGRVVSGSAAGEIHLWDPVEGRLLRSITGHETRIDCLAAMEDGSVVMGANYPLENLKLFDVSDGRCLRTMGHNFLPVVSVAVLEEFIISGHTGMGEIFAVLTVWDSLSGRPLRNLFPDSTAWIRSVAVLPEWGRVISGAQNGSIMVWDLPEGACIQKLGEGEGWIQCAAALPDGRIVVAGTNGNVKVFSDLQRHAEKYMSKAVARQRACGDVVSEIDKFV